jgi:hypothetical protein
MSFLFEIIRKLNHPKLAAVFNSRSRPRAAPAPTVLLYNLLMCRDAVRGGADRRQHRHPKQVRAALTPTDLLRPMAIFDLGEACC